MTSDEVDEAVRNILKEYLGYKPTNALVIICNGKDTCHIISNAPNSETTIAFLRAIVEDCVPENKTKETLQ